MNEDAGLTMRAGTQRRLALLLRALGGTVVIGAVVGGANGFGFRDAPFLGTMLGALGGATNGAILVVAILGTEIFLWGIGSCGAPRPSMGGYVTVTGATLPILILQTLSTIISF